MGRSVAKQTVRGVSSEGRVRVRFAPSPTGHLHLGGLRTALYNMLYARSLGGALVLRLEDTDQTRLVPGAAEQLEQSLVWAGVRPDESPLLGGESGPYTQSQRLQLYTDHADILLQSGYAYRCFCSERRLELLRKEAVRSRSLNKYDRRCLGLSQQEVQDRLGRGEPHTVRLLLQPELHSFHDLVYGQFTYDVFANEGDPIIVKSDKFPTYHLANVVDDHLMRITHVLRGVEWQVSTPKHLQLYRAFGWQPPQFGHLPLIMNSDGTKLSKRQGDLHLDSLRRAGFSPAAVINFITLSGGGFDEKDVSLDRLFTMEELTAKFNIKKVHTASCKIEMDKLNILNRVDLKQSLSSEIRKDKLLRRCTALVKDKLGVRGLPVDKIDNDTVEKHLVWAQDRINKLEDLVSEDMMFLWHRPTKHNNNIVFDKEIVDKIVLIFSNHEKETCNKQLMSELKRLSQSTGLKFPAFMKELRVLLTGKPDGPPILELLEILGHTVVQERLLESDFQS